MISIRVFTHPTCVTCPQAIQLAQETAVDNSDIELRIVSLGSARGREVAKTARVLSVPTIFVGEHRFTGVPKRDEFLAVIEEQRRG